MAIDFVPGMDISASGLKAERVRMKVASNNMANANSTADKDGNVYQRRQVILSPEFKDHVGSALDQFDGVKVTEVTKADRPPEKEYAPDHPKANEEGMVKKANISPLEEMLDMMTAMRAYESNLTSLKQSREMAQRVIDLLK